MQVAPDGGLPAGLCTECWASAVQAANFRSMCRQTSHKWDVTLHLLNNLPSQYSEENKIMYAVLNDNQMIVYIDENESNSELEPHQVDEHDLNISKSELNDEKYRENNDDISDTACKKFERQFLRRDRNKNLNKSNIRFDKRENKNRVAIQCPVCGKNFIRPIKLCQHLKESMDMKRACHICSVIMPRDDLVSHCIKIHNIQVFDCKICPAILLSNSIYVNHLKKAHSNGCGQTCIECGQTFQTSHALCAHTSIHRQKSCPSCGKTFLNQKCYLYHIKNCVVESRLKSRVDVKNEIVEESYKCDYCGKKFTKKKYIAAHIQIIHLKNTHAPCAYCGKMLATAHMTEHLKKHELDLSFTCQHCGIVLKTKLGYTQHLRLHTGERPYTCTICKETFSASSRRSEHMRKAHKGLDAPKHECTLCPAKFRLPYKLRKHMQSAHINEVGKSLQFECKECHKNFGSSRGLLHHSRKHQKVAFVYKRPKKSVVLDMYRDEK